MLKLYSKDFTEGLEWELRAFASKFCDKATGKSTTADVAI